MPSNKVKTSQPAQIVATSRPSRFHVDTLSTLSKEIDLKDVQISIGQKDILSNAHLRLKENVRYSLVGRNGVGKSTVLKAISEKLIPGLPENLRILLAGQVEGNEIGDMGSSVLQRVMDSDQRLVALTKEYEVLSSSLDQTSAEHALANIEYGRAQADLFTAQKLAELRSRTRGSDARKALLAAEARFKKAEEELQNPPQHDDAMVQIQNLTEEVKHAMDVMDASSSESSARKILLGLGFFKEQIDSPYVNLSGGWRSRCSLASVLFQKPDLVILDEPTNYLDIPSILWLQSYLLSLKTTTVLLVAHDRSFLDAVTEETIMLRDGKLAYHDGAISMTERAIMKKRKGLMRMQEGLDKKKAHIEKSIVEGARMAKKTGDETRAKMVKSRQRKLDDRFGLEVNAKGHRFKLNRDMPTYHTSRRVDIEIEDSDPPINLPFPEPDELRFSGVLCSMSDVSFRYRAKDHLVIDSANLSIHPGGRVGLVGKNGEGKSTLVKLIIGQVKPVKGSVERHPRVKIGYYSQHSVEELSSPSIAQTSSLSHFIEELRAKHGIDIDEKTAFAFLGSFGLHGKTASVLPIANLSGGQKVRLALALVVYPAPQLLVLDEVSTHLDMDTNTALIKSLRRYSGAILLVSHDRHLVRCIIEGAPATTVSEDESDDSSRDDEEGSEVERELGMVYKVGPKGRVKQLSGGVDEYVQIVERRLGKGILN